MAQESEQEREFDPSATLRFPTDELLKYPLERKGASLVVLLGADLGVRIPLSKPEVTLGRTAEADVLLHDEQISRRHLVIRTDLAAKTYTLVDLNSTNGTLVNHQRVAESVLKDGDKIFIGSTVLKFVLEDPIESEHLDALNRWVFTDDLTGLVVKRRFYDQLRFQIGRALDRSERLALLMMDLDGLKQVNDAHGHAMGAFVIGQVGRRIGEIVNPLGQASRFGGDEFVAYLSNHDVAAALSVAEKIRAAIQDSAFEKDGKMLKVSISIGVAVLPEAARDLEELNKAADEALYRAKGKGRNCVSE